jgi:hypothetical protein
MIVLLSLILTVHFTTNAQYKVGVFDIDVMVQLLPEYGYVDSALDIYNKDSLSQEYDFYQKEYLKLDSAYRVDSALKKSKVILEFKKSQREQVAFTLINFNKVAEYKINQKRTILAKPLYERVFSAYKKVQLAKKYDLILKPGSYEILSNVDNVFVWVAKELNVSLPPDVKNFGTVK